MFLQSRKLLALFLSAVILLTALPPVFSAFAYSGGSGTTDDPYLISTANDFLNISSNPGKVFRQTCNISLVGKSFSPIYSFTGTYDGGGFAVEGLTYSGTMEGVFVYNTGTIKNLKLKDCNLTVIRVL